MAEDGALQIKARRYVEDLRGDVASRLDLLAMTRLANLETAAMLYYESLLNSRRDAEFIRAVNAVKASAVTAEQRAAHNNIEILIVPSVFGFVSRWEALGSDEVEKIRARFRALGFKTDVALTEPGLTLDENAQRIGQAVIGASAPKVILLSRGRGSLEVRLLFHVLKNSGFDLSRLIGWVSVCGPLNGLRSFDDDRRSWSRFKLEAGARLARESVEALQAAAASQPVWSLRLPLPERVSLVQIVGVPRREQLGGVLRARYDVLREGGPNDGLQFLADAHIDAGLVVPVWGLAPSFAWSDVTGLVERSILMMADLPALRVPPLEAR